MQIACDNNHSHYCKKRMFGFQFGQLNWPYYVQETVSPEVKVVPEFFPLSFFYIQVTI